MPTKEVQQQEEREFEAIKNAARLAHQQGLLTEWIVSYGEDLRAGATVMAAVHHACREWDI